jgi:hypothetical protein
MKMSSVKRASLLKGRMQDSYTTDSAFKMPNLLTEASSHPL